MTLHLLTASEQPAAWAGWLADPAFAGIAGHPIHGRFGQQFYPAVFGESWRDVSCAVVQDETPVLLMPAGYAAGELGYFGMPIRLFARQGLGRADYAAAIAALLRYIDGLVAGHGLHQVRLLDLTAGGQLSPLGEACLGRRYVGQLRLDAHCDLSLGEAGWRKSLRKSFRSLINWGRANLTLAHVNAHNPDRAAFDAFQNFHLAVAGRSTRPQASWEAMYDCLATGGGELTLAYLAGGELVAGNLVVDGASASYYASGVYDRERFDKPMAHWPLWHALQRSRERGMTVFDLGELPQAGMASAKEVDIGYFKRGFATCIAVALEWQWNAA